jgi:hypothetical protein
MPKTIKQPERMICMLCGAVMRSRRRIVQNPICNPCMPSWKFDQAFVKASNRDKELIDAAIDKASEKRFSLRIGT